VKANPLETISKFSSQTVSLFVGILQNFIRGSRGLGASGGSTAPY
jgi:hypothetical protein